MIIDRTKYARRPITRIIEWNWSPTGICLAKTFRLQLGFRFQPDRRRGRWQCSLRGIANPEITQVAECDVDIAADNEVSQATSDDQLFADYKFGGT